MLEQEIASIIKFVLDSTGNPSPYYWKVPQAFAVPSAYFPEPEIISGPDTFLTYSMNYAWYIKLFANTDNEAYLLGLQAVSAIRGARNLIPAINEDGENAGKYVRVKDPSMKLVDTGACQLTVEWVSRRPYNDERGELMQTYEIEGWSHPDVYLQRTISAVMESAIESYLTDYPNDAEYAGEYPDEE